MEQAYSFLTIKSVDEEQRVVHGIASTPTPDSEGDIVEPKGAKFTLPLPFCDGHPKLGGKPIGNVVKADTRNDGIHIIAQIAKNSGLDYVEMAWKQIKAGLLRGLSVGFVPIEKPERLANGGNHYKSWRFAELSAVVVPMNMHCSIQVVKSLTHEPRALSGTRAVSLSSAVAASTKGNTSMNYAENIEAAKRKREGLVTDLKGLTDSLVTKGETGSAEEMDKAKTLQDEIKSVDAHLTLLTNTDQVLKGFSIGNSGNDDVRSTSLNGHRPYMAVQGPKLEPGQAFARVVKCFGRAKGNVMMAEQIAKNLYKDDPRISNLIKGFSIEQGFNGITNMDMVTKAVVTAGSTATCADFLVGDESTIVADFLAYLRPKTIIGQFGTGNIPSLSRIGFRVPYLTQTGAGAGYWVGEGKAKPLTAFAGTRATLEPLKVANIAVLTKEAIRDSSPSSEVWIRDQLVEALRSRLDIDFIDPAKAASAGISPASITNAITPITASGTTAAALRLDLKNLFTTFIEANNAPTSAVWLMSSALALGISLLTNALGQPEFPGITMNGGSLAGIPVLTSEHVPNATAGGIIVLVNARDVFLADEGGFEVNMSDEASLQMDDAPTQSSVTTVAATSVVSMFQTNSVAFLAERTMNWVLARASGVGYIQTANYGE